MALDFQETIREMEGRLSLAQHQRSQRQAEIPSNNPNSRHKELGWVVFERQAMFDALNAERQVHKLPPITMETFIDRVETLAYGHSDYTHKLALYCAEMAHGRIPAP
jgi:uncharacterized protein YkwD